VPLLYFSHRFSQSTHIIRIAKELARATGSEVVRAGNTNTSVDGVQVFLDMRGRPVVSRMHSKSNEVRISRFAATVPKMGEVHWLRRLLLCRHARSHLDLRTNLESQCVSPGFAAAAIEQGFVDTSDPTCEYMTVFEEAKARQSRPSDLRTLFSSLLWTAWTVQMCGAGSRTL